MRPGTPFFVAGKLLEAREGRGLSAAALADLVEVRRETVYQLESGKITPGPALFERLQIALRMPAAFFFDPLDDREQGDLVLFRSLRSATKPARQRARWRLHWLKRITHFVEEFVDLPPFDVPDYDLQMDPLNIPTQHIEEIAEDLRRRWVLGQGPISNITWLLENRGIILAREDLGAEDLDAAILGIPTRVFVLLGADKGTDVRSRMDAAHELGHILLHRHCPAPTSDKDPRHKVMEQQAFRFAGAFLLPADSFGSDVWSCTLEEFLALKPKWRVAVSAMILRASHLGLISEDKQRRLWQQYSRRRWKKGEPFDAEWTPEQPVLLRRSVELVLDAGAASVDRFLSELKLPPTDIELLAGLSPGTLSHGPSPIRFRGGASTPSAFEDNVLTFDRQPKPSSSNALDRARS